VRLSINSREAETWGRSPCWQGWGPDSSAIADAPNLVHEGGSADPEGPAAVTTISAGSEAIYKLRKASCDSDLRKTGVNTRPKEPDLSQKKTGRRLQLSLESCETLCAFFRRTSSRTQVEYRETNNACTLLTTTELQSWRRVGIFKPMEDA